MYMHKFDIDDIYDKGTIFNEMLIFFSTKDAWVLLFLMEHFITKMDISRYYSSPNSQTLTVSHQK